MGGCDGGSEQSDAGSCAGDEPGCRSSGTEPECPLETSRQPRGYRQNLPQLIMCLQRAQNLQSQ